MSLARWPSCVRVAVFTSMLATFALSTSRADAATQIDFQVLQKDVVVGEPFQVSLSLLDSNGGNVSQPKLRLPESIVLRGQMMGPQIFVSGSVRFSGLNATYTLEAKKKGTFSIGPVTASLNGKTVTSKSITVTVLDAKPGRGGGRSSAPSPWGPLGKFFDDDDEPKLPEVEDADPKLALPTALGAQAFLHATLDKESAVLGEQRTLSVFLYQDMDLPAPEILNASEPTTEGFLTKSLLPSGQEPPDVGKAKIGERRYRVRLVRKLALFPVQAGKLSVSPMRLKLRSRGSGDRASEAFNVLVSEPPKEGRPGSYVMGTTGTYRIECKVEPRTSADGIVGVTARLDGFGLFPDRLNVPSTQNIVFEAPDIRDNLVADEGGHWGGFRSFQYVVRVSNQGKVDLGSLALPYFSPESGKYESASCTLGTISVQNAAITEKPDDAPSPLLLELPKPETGLSAVRSPEFQLPRAATLGFWIGPASLVLVGVVRVWPKRKERAASAGQLWSEAVKRAEGASREGRTEDALGEVERGLSSAVLEKFGVSLRADSAAEARDALLEKGAAASTIEEILSLRASCIDLRYGASKGTLPESLLARAKALREVFR